MNPSVPRRSGPQRALIESYAADTIRLDEMLDRLCAIAVPARVDPTGGDGYLPGTRNAIEAAVQDGLLDEDDWDAIVTRVAKCPALRAIE